MSFEVIDLLIPAGFALFLWWFGTGVIVYLDGLPKQTFRRTMSITSVIALIALVGLVYSKHDMTATGALISFSCGLLLWGWQELSYFLGFITGPRKDACQEECKGWRHFIHALQVNLYHELAIIAGAIAIILLTRDGANQIGTWTYLLLWWMQLSAKLNVFLGVRNLSEEFLPKHMNYMKSFLKKRKMNCLFPFSVTFLTILCVYLIQQALSMQPGSFQVLHYSLLATLVALALIEHWLLVLPISSTALWDVWLRLRDKQYINQSEYKDHFFNVGDSRLSSQVLIAATSDSTIKTQNSAQSACTDVLRNRPRGEY
ncbi:MAG: putative photosynthetic complex assembly protein PuhE [Pseudomonadota bacterium]